MGLQRLGDFQRGFPSRGLAQGGIDSEFAGTRGRYQVRLATKEEALTENETVTQGYQNKALKLRHTTTSSIFWRALNREIFETSECLEREVPLNTVEDVNTVRTAFR